MKHIASSLLALGTAAALAAPAGAEPRPRWEIGVGAAATYSPANYGLDDDSFGGFPIAWVTYRGDNFSILPNGIFDVAAYETDSFDFRLSFDTTGDIDSEDRLFLGDIDTVLEIGPAVNFALYADGRSRFEVTLAARVAYEFGEDFEGWVLEPEIAYLTTLTSSTRAGIYVAPKFGFGDYNDLFYSTPGFDAEEGYLGTAIGLKMATDFSERWRLSADVKGIVTSGSKVEDSPLVTEDWNVAARISLTYVLWQSETMTDR